MCESGLTRSEGWRGWIELPPPRCLRASGPWTDLSHPLSAKMPHQAYFPTPSFKRHLSKPEFHLNITRIDMLAHTGTHVDSPRHCYEDAPAFEDVPLERLFGAGLVWPTPVVPGEDISAEHLEPALEQLQRGDMLLLNTGLHHIAGTPAYDDHPALTLAAAQWLIDHGVKLVGLDFPTPDLAHSRRPQGFDFPVHHLLLAHGVLIAEHLTNLDTLNGRRVEAMCNALNVAGGDGAPARILARPLDD